MSEKLIYRIVPMFGRGCTSSRRSQAAKSWLIMFCRRITMYWQKTGSQTLAINAVLTLIQQATLQDFRKFSMGIVKPNST